MTHLVDFMLFMPLAPQLLRGLGMPLAALGEFVFAYTASAGVAGLALGATIHRFSRCKLLLIVYAGFGASLLLTVLAGSFAWLIAARVLAGACGGVLSSLVQATVVDFVPFERRAAALGTVMTELGDMANPSESHDEFAVVDNKGRIKIPEEYIAQLKLSGGERLKIRKSAGGIEVYKS